MLCSATVASAGPWCSGQTCQPVTLEIAGSNPVGPATSRFGGYDGAVKLPGPGRVTAVAAVTLLVGCVNPSPSLVPDHLPAPPHPDSPANSDGHAHSRRQLPARRRDRHHEPQGDDHPRRARDARQRRPSSWCRAASRSTQPELTATAPCVAADQIVADLQADQTLVALLPPGLVEPATKVLSIAGDGPFGLFGPDLFGDPESRALPYPVMGSAPADGPDRSTRPGPHTTPPRSGT